jgi:hypothetical protein
MHAVARTSNVCFGPNLTDRVVLLTISPPFREIAVWQVKTKNIKMPDLAKDIFSFRVMA